MSATKKTTATIKGILNINKPRATTSQDVVSHIKYISKQRHVGHAGTLDPIATGVLPICLGQATRMSSFIMDNSKTYIAEIVLGISTDTYDSEGNIVQYKDPSYVTREQLDSLFPTLTGRIMQKPPSFSALKYRGKRLYELARAGIAVEPNAREVTIYRLDLLEWNRPNLVIEVECSKGTYIRSIAHDIGQYLGCGAHLSSLIRTKYGIFTLADSISLQQFEDAFNQGFWQELLYPMDIAINDWSAIIVTPEQEHDIAYGRLLSFPTHNEKTLCRAYSSDGRFIAILRALPDKGGWQPERVFI